MNGRITVLGEPVAKERPRVGRHGNVYTPRNTVAFETTIAFSARAQLPKYKEKERLIVDLGFFCSTDNKDLDNLCKSVLDGLQKQGRSRTTTKSWRYTQSKPRFRKVRTREPRSLSAPLGSPDWTYPLPT